MTVESLCTRPATLVTVTDGAEDDYGNVTEVETATSVLCELQQSRAGENDEWQVGTYRLFLPIGTGVTGLDRIEVDGDIYDFEGQPWKVWNPRLSTYSHFEAKVMLRQ